MSEEEIIKYIKNIRPKNFNNYKDETACCLITKKQIKMIENLLELYQKEKEKNKKSKDVISKLNENWVSKPCLKDMLEKMKDQERELTDGQGYWGGTGLQAQIEILEELLGEEE